MEGRNSFSFLGNYRLMVGNKGLGMNGLGMPVGRKEGWFIVESPWSELICPLGCRTDFSFPHIALSKSRRADKECVTNSGTFRDILRCVALRARTSEKSSHFV